ncbi:MAG: hypothetical protein IJB97_09240 [Clostridia bacterium]|nr:hypothetical protein [Clostridia bacterium]
MLANGNINNNEFSYAYGPDNLRYKKTVNGAETLYYWDGDLLVGEKTGNVYTEYLYDESGIIGMIHDNVYYYFEKNLLGDVLRVYRMDGNTLVASFDYDPYGNIISQSGAMIYLGCSIIRVYVIKRQERLIEKIFACILYFITVCLITTFFAL